MIDSGGLASLGFLLLGFRLRTTLSLVTLAVAIPTVFGEGAGLHMAWSGGWAVARAAEAVLLNPQDFGWVLRLLLLLPLEPARLATSCRGGEGLRMRFGG